MGQIAPTANSEVNLKTISPSGCVLHRRKFGDLILRKPLILERIVSRIVSSSSRVMLPLARMIPPSRGFFGPDARNAPLAYCLSRNSRCVAICFSTSFRGFIYVRLTMNIRPLHEVPFVKSIASKLIHATHFSILSTLHLNQEWGTVSWSYFHERGKASKNSTGSPLFGLTISASHMTLIPRTKVPTGQPVTVLP